LEFPLYFCTCNITDILSEQNKMRYDKNGIERHKVDDIFIASPQYGQTYLPSD